MLEKNEEFTVVIEDISEDGAGIGKTEGFTWFVKDTVIGDVVEAKVMKKKKNYGFARLVRVITPSPDRLEPKCAVARACGGCQLQAMDYKAQLRFKERKIYGHLTRIGGVEELALPGEARAGREDAAGEGESLPGEARAGRGHAAGGGESVLEMEPILGMENPWRYRNKAQFPCGRNKDGKIVFGFYAGRTHAIIEQNDCVLGIEENGKILEIIGQFMEEFGIEPYDEQGHSGLVRHVLIRKGFKTGEIMVCLVMNGDRLVHGEELVKRLKKVEGMVSVSCNINRERTNVILGEKMVNLFGPGYITDRIGEVTYQISPQSFYQVNPLQTEKLYQTALEYAGLTGEETVCTAGLGRFLCFWRRRQRRFTGWKLSRRQLRMHGRMHGLMGLLTQSFTREGQRRYCRSSMRRTG